MFDISVNKRLIFGEKKIKEAAQIYKWYRCSKVFIVTYNKEAKALLEIINDLNNNNIEYYIFDNVQGEPDLNVINEGKEMFIQERCDSVLGLGGGSVIDAAKAIAMLSANGGLIQEYQIDGREVTKESPFFIAIPTTSGTGAEATKVSVIYNNIHNIKKSVYHPTMIADVTILDPEVTLDLPPQLTASTGMDALSHAIESYVSLNANPLTEMYSLKALELIASNLELCVDNGKNLKARGELALGSYLAGCSLNAGIGIAHIVAQPIGGLFKIPHGDACSIFLPLAMELNLIHSVKKYKKIAEVMGINTQGISDIDAASLGITRVKQIRKNINAPDSLKVYIKDNEFTIQAALENIKKSTGHIKCNPREVDEQLITEILKKAL